MHLWSECPLITGNICVISFWCIQFYKINAFDWISSYNHLVLKLQGFSCGFSLYLCGFLGSYWCPATVAWNVLPYSLMLAKAAFMASGYRRTETAGSRYSLPWGRFSYGMELPMWFSTHTQRHTSPLFHLIEADNFLHLSPKLVLEWSRWSWKFGFGLDRNLAASQRRWCKCFSQSLFNTIWR